MDACRRTWLVCLIAGLSSPAGLIRTAVAQEVSQRVIEVRIEDRKVVAPSEVIRLIEGDAYAAGRFPITSHGWGEGSHGDTALTYLEVYPD
jgi:hypothetical protein